MRNILIVLSGPSGVGKGTIVKEILKKADMSLSISCTTREPRFDETDGKEYFFISREEFLSKIKQGYFLEYSEHFGNIYGTPKNFVLDKLKEKDVILEIDVNGGLNIKKEFKDAVLVLILPPSIDALKKRLTKRSTETAEQIEERLSRIGYEEGKKGSFDYTVINDELDVAVKEVLEIIKKEKNK